MKNIRYFFTGALTALVLFGSSISVMAADGALSISVYPTKVMVNGQAFQPTDSLGNPVPIFSYDGTTYAPIKALANAYGLDVGYNTETKLVTVSGSTENTPTHRFADCWQVSAKPNSGSTEEIYTATYCGPLNLEQFKLWWKAQNIAAMESSAAEMAKAAAKNSDQPVLMYFSYANYNLGNALASKDYATATFDVSAVWIK